jgi:hypothetical protein
MIAAIALCAPALKKILLDVKIPAEPVQGKRRRAPTPEELPSQPG